MKTNNHIYMNWEAIILNNDAISISRVLSYRLDAIAHRIFCVVETFVLIHVLVLISIGYPLYLTFGKFVCTMFYNKETRNVRFLW